MGEKDPRDEKLDLRCLYLRLLKKLPLVLAGIVCGALLGGVLYHTLRTMRQEVVYEAPAVCYLNFAYDESGEVYDHYNAYTWNTIIHTDTVMEETMRELGDSPFVTEKGFTAKEAGDALTATTPSDGRVLVITGRWSDPGFAEECAHACAKGLVSFGEKMDEFTSIEVMELGEAERVKYDNRLYTACIAGAVLGGLAALLALWLIASLDDAVYVPEEAERRYSFPVIAMLAGKGSLPSRLREESIKGLDKLVKEEGTTVAICAPVSGGDEEKQAKLLCEELKELCTGEASFVPYTETGKDAVLLAVRAGARDGAWSLHTLETLDKAGRKVKGVLLYDCDAAFLARYYRLKG